MASVATTNLFDWTCQHLSDQLVTRAIPERLKSDPSFVPAAAERICDVMFRLCHQDLAQYEQAVDDFVDYSMEFVRLQSELERTGQYHFTSYAKLCEQVYENREVMQGRFLNGLFLTQALWINHHKILNYFCSRFCDTQLTNGSVLEVPAGTGIYISEFVERNPSWSASAVDLSESAVDFSQRVVDLLVPGAVNVQCQNVFALADDVPYNRIICGLLLENFEDPNPLLQKLRQLLSTDGRLFMTISVWAAAIDHIYVFTRTQQVRELLDQYFAIEDELVLNIDPDKGPEDDKTPINYAVILRPSG